jgi:hypothetical protein
MQRVKSFLGNLDNNIVHRLSLDVGTSPEGSSFAVLNLSFQPKFYRSLTLLCNACLESLNDRFLTYISKKRYRDAFVFAESIRNTTYWSAGAGRVRVDEPR